MPIFAGSTTEFVKLFRQPRACRLKDGDSLVLEHNHCATMFKARTTFHKQSGQVTRSH